MSNCEKIIELEKRIKELEDRLNYWPYPSPIPYYPLCPDIGRDTATDDGTGISIIWSDK